MQTTKQSKTNNKPRGFWSENELHRLSDTDGRLILVTIFADRGVSRGQRDGFPTSVNLGFLDWSRYFSFK
jgi:hypothetical protein